MSGSPRAKRPQAARPEKRPCHAAMYLAASVQGTPTVRPRSSELGVRLLCSSSIKVARARFRLECTWASSTENSCLITGVLTDRLACVRGSHETRGAGRRAHLTGFGRGLSLTERSARKLASSPEVIEVDVPTSSTSKPPAERVATRFGSSMASSTRSASLPNARSGRGMFEADWNDVATTLQVSAYSLKPLVEAFLPLFEVAGGGSVVGLDFDASVAWPGYDWMGVAKAAYESLARYLGTRPRPTQYPGEPHRRGADPNDSRRDRSRLRALRRGMGRARAAGLGRPSRPGLRRAWRSRAVVGSVRSHTGEIVHVDGGFHAVGA